MTQAKPHTNLSQEKFHPASLLREIAQQQPDKKALIVSKCSLMTRNYHDHAITYSDLEKASDHVASQLLASGIKQGDKTIFMLKASHELFVYFFALLKIGAIPILVDPGMGLKRMLHCYRSVGASAFVGIPIANHIRRLLPRFFRSIHASVTVKPIAWDKLSRLNLKAPKKFVFPLTPKTQNDLALISFTTGSTGPAKGVEYSYGMVHAMKQMIQSHYAFTSNDVQFLTSPFFGVLGFMMGKTCILPDMNPAKPASASPKILVDTIRRYQATAMFASPALLNTLGHYAEKHSISLPSLLVVSSGGAPMTRDTMQRFRKVLTQKAKFDTTWGTTEGLPLTSIQIETLLNETSFDMQNGLGTCIGQPVSPVQVHAVQLSEQPIPTIEKAQICAPGEVGELIVQGPNISAHYHDQPEFDAVHKIKDGAQIWHRTGDLGWIDAKGRIWFCGRKSHQVSIQGKVINSVQIEGIVNSHPFVYRSALTSATMGQEKIAVICIELNQRMTKHTRMRVEREIRHKLSQHRMTRTIDTLLFPPKFPVDIRHNAKIDRGALGIWATKHLKQRGGLNG
ncbi:fatty acid CoA ligase family protein [Algicola sagamiensis]|uniref:fatty acid CoA ligase family protein n=1 Tax=Algicola sagamiensis TaxID=163869 RepID=UPI000360F37B|nr:fatty acid CoA ligase family protein [Algicola sagamiensis]